ncbi:hypothetical protein KXV68_001246, partial [Aspergillus fumigatus]
MPLTAHPNESVEAIQKSSDLTALTSKCWAEIFMFFHSLRPPPSSTIAVFEPTPGFEPVVTNVLSPDEYSKVSSPLKPMTVSEYKTKGLVYFHPLSSIGKSLTVLVPLHVDGTAFIEGKSINTDSYYHVFRQSNIEVSENGRLAA